MFSTKYFFKKKNTIKMIGHHVRLRDVTGKCYSIYACTSANHARHSLVQVMSVIFYGSWRHNLLK